MAKHKAKSPRQETSWADPTWKDGRESLAHVALTEKPAAIARELEKLAGLGDPLALRVLVRLERHGISDRWLQDIDQSLRNVSVFTHPSLDGKTGKFVWVKDYFRTPTNTLRKPPAVFGGAHMVFDFVLMCLVNAGTTDNAVVRCEAPAPKRPYEDSNEKCGNRFFSRSNKDWCSTTCQVRVSSRRARR